MRILMSGASGLVGTALVAALRARGDDVGALVRGDAAADGLDVRWDPAAGSIDVDALARGSFDAVVHLAGEPLLGRWNDDKRASILASRVDGTGLLARSIAALDAAPRALVCASAVGIYGSRGEEVLTEQSRPGEGFLADVVRQWEAAAEPAREAGIRTVHLRAGAVLAKSGGALAEQLLPFRLGVGGPVGGGRQWSAWVGLDEIVAIFLFALDDARVEGAVNAVGPTPARQSQHAKAIGRALHRPSFMPVPAFAVRLLFGAVADELVLASQKVVPARLEALGYEFQDRTVDGAMRRALAR